MRLMLRRIVYLLAYQLWRLFPRLLLCVPAIKVAAVAAIGGATLYAALAGFSIPTTRALIMLSVFMLAQLAGRSVSSQQTLFTALLIIVLLDPLSVLAVGFWQRRAGLRLGDHLGEIIVADCWGAGHGGTSRGEEPVGVAFLGDQHAVGRRQNRAGEGLELSLLLLPRPTVVACQVGMLPQLGIHVGG